MTSSGTIGEERKIALVALLLTGTVSGCARLPFYRMSELTQGTQGGNSLSSSLPIPQIFCHMWRTDHLKASPLFPFPHSGDCSVKRKNWEVKREIEDFRYLFFLIRRCCCLFLPFAVPEM